MSKFRIFPKILHMQIRQFIFSILLVFAVSACSSESAKDIKTKDIKNVCDCVDSLQMVVDELSILKDSDPTTENKAQIKLLQNKLNDIRNHCYKQFKIEKMKECKGFKELEKDINDLR